MSYYLGFDGGGTKTECALFGGDRSVLGRGVAGPSNPLRAGFPKALAALREAAELALNEARIGRRDIRGVCAGLGGAGRPRVVQRMAALLGELFPQAAIRIVSDLEIALEAAVGSGQGIVLVAGTGSAAYGRNAAGQTARAGGWGWWIGDEGSAFDIGRRAVAAAARARDGLGPSTRLEAMILADLQCADWESLIERLAVKPDESFPRVYPLVVAAAEAGDAAASSILLDAATSLAELASGVIGRLHLAREEFVLAKSGGVFGRSKSLDAALDAFLASAAPRARVQMLAIPPAEAAARLARSWAEEVAHGGAR